MHRIETVPLVVAIALAACNGATGEQALRPRPEPTKRTSVPAPPVRPTVPPPVHRTRGDIEGQILPERSRYAVGEPIFVRMDVRNTGTAPLSFNFGGDWFGHLLPMRYGWRVWDEHGTLLCDLARPTGRGVAGGGMGGTTTVAPGETHHDTHLLNDVCDAMTRPGRYRLTVVRVLSRREALTRRRPGQVPEVWCNDLTPPDLTTLAPGSPDPYEARSVECVDALRQFPIVVSELSLEITPWDPAALRTTFAALPAQREAAARGGDLSREGALSTFGSWFCDRVRCDCAESIRYQRVDDWLAQALSRVPETFSGPCPEH